MDCLPSGALGSGEGEEKVAASNDVSSARNLEDVLHKAEMKRHPECSN